MSKQIKSLLKPTDFILTDGKTLIVVESAEEATKQQELMAYEKAGQPIYLLTLASVALVTKKDAKAIKKQLKAAPVATQPLSDAEFATAVQEAIDDPSPTIGHEELWTELTALAEAQGNNNVH